MKTEFADQLQNLLNDFLNRFQEFKSHEHLFDIFYLPFHTDVNKAPTEMQLELIKLQARIDLKTKYWVEEYVCSVFIFSFILQ